MATKFITDVRGMTLIDMAIALLIISLLTVPLVQIYNAARQDSIRGTTNANLDAVKKAIDDYYFNFGDYPCPADLTIGPGNPNYGREACASANVIIAGQPILRGGVPFATLQIPVDYTLDGWSHKITYTVTTAQTTPPPVGTPFPMGVLTINKIDCIGLPPNECGVQGPAISAAPPPSAEPPGHYILISHGEDGIGAYNENGVLAQGCPPPGPTFTREAENCNDNLIFWERNNDRTVSLGANTDYYDDVTLFSADAPTRKWTNSTNDANNIFSSEVVSIGINNDNPVAQLDVKGNIKADTNTAGDTLCDKDGTNSTCFTTSAFTQNNGQMQCNNISSSVMNGVVGDNSALKVSVACATTSFPQATPNQACPGAQRVIGITAGGTIQCAP